jgi:beta-glucanase (GH16 family)
MQRRAGTFALLIFATTTIALAQPAAPGVPAALTLTVSGSLVTLTWSAPVSGGVVSSYVIEAGSATGAANVAVFATGSAATRIAVSAPVGVYFVRVRARNAAGNSNPSNEIVAIVAPAAFRDDFNGTSLDGSKWYVPEGLGTYIKPTQMRPASEPPAVTNGVARCRVDTFNPTALTPGDSFWGCEIVTRRMFERGRGLMVRARVRVGELAPPGLVASIFSYVYGPGVHDEIDFELLTNHPRAVLTNLYHNEPDNPEGRPLLVTTPSLNIHAFNDYAFVWLSDTMYFLVNGTVVRQISGNIPPSP